jgi:cytochrome c553
MIGLSLVYVLSAAIPTFSAEEPPPWAYPVNPPDFKPRPEDGILRRVPGSGVTHSVTQLSDRFLAPVWHPDDHPSLPQIVATGRKPNVLACGFCHREDGSGGPENSNLAGLPAAYIVQQMADFKTGARKSSVPKRGPVSLMISLSKDITDAEVEAAAVYFSALKPRTNIRVVETDTVPTPFVAGWFHLKGLGGIPPIAGRSPSYVVRQLYDIQSGARVGVATQLMRQAVANLTVDDMLSIAAYLASLTP